MRIGIDVGGTHTDAVLLEGGRVLAATKALTSADVITGVTQALDTILRQAAVPQSAIETVMIGTTQFTNAIIERRNLAPTAILRIALPAGRGMPPMIDWPDDIADAIGRHVYELDGGYLYDGYEMAPLNEAQIDRAIADAAGKGLRNFAIASAFSPMNAGPEEHVAAKVRAAIPGAHITLSHAFGRLGLMERESAAILNATLLQFADHVVASFLGALKARALTCPVFISQNDGTLMNADFVRQFPALTFASGPTNSLRGAAKLTGLSEAVVVDIGGTTSDIGVLQGGFPRQSNTVIEIGGVRTNFRMPDILAIGLGGGSHVRADGSSVGPQSVGHNLVRDGLVFGGAVLTATDIIVASGAADVGDAAKVRNLDPAVVARARTQMTTMLDRNIEMMKPGAAAMPVILVGGGAILASDDLKAASQVYRPENAGVANAIGAAIAQIGGEAERIISYSQVPREDAIAQITHDAQAAALKAGADKSSLRTAEIEEVEVPYMEGDTTRLRVKVIGDLAVNKKDAA